MYAQTYFPKLSFTKRQWLLAGLLFVLTCGMMLVINPGKVSAMTASDIPASVAPVEIRQNIADHCNPAPGGSGWSSVIVEWVSASNAPTATSVTVQYGATAVPLQLNYITYRCETNRSPDTVSASMKIEDTDPNIPALNGRVDQLPFVSASVKGYRSGKLTSFNYTVSKPGLTSTRDVIIKFVSVGTLTKNGPIYGAGAGDSSANCNSTYSTCYYCALSGDEYQHPTTSPTNFDPAPGYCVSGPGSFRIRVNVVSPAYLDGVKIDDSKEGTYGGDETNSAYENATVSVSGVGSDKGNPFYFDASGNGSGPIPVGSSGTTRTVSVGGSIGTGWVVAGYSICDDTVAVDCASSTLEYGGKYFNATSAKSFTYNFKSGHRYHMRWIFKSLVQLSCGSLGLTPSTVDAYTRFSVRPSVNLGTTTYKPTGAEIRLTISPNSAGATWSYGPTTRGAPANSAGVASAGFGPMGPVNSPGNYMATWVYSADGGFGIVCNETIPVVNMPYLTVYGGDTMVGAMATTQAGTCYSGSADAGAYSWNNHTGYVGAGSQYAVMVMGQIEDYASNLTGNGSGANPTKLSFANTEAGTVNTAGGLFGGKFGAPPVSCDLTSDLADAGTPKVTAANASAQMANGTGIKLNSGDEKIIYASGDVHIDKNIMYTSTSWAKLSDIPSFKLVVEGNIYIGAGVTWLDGVYVALPDAGGNGGTIYTCATGTTPAKPIDPNFYDECHSPLVINGAFAAKQVQFLRTSGSIGQARGDSVGNSHGAEEFNYSPEVWLPRGNQNPSLQYDSITGLPPVL